MALDKAYFDSLHFELIKKRFYYADKVNDILADIQEQAETLMRKNELLAEENLYLRNTGGDAGNAKEIMQSTRTVAQQMLEEAKQEAAEIIRRAEEERDSILARAREQQDRGVQTVERCFSAMSRHYEDCMKAVNTEWKDFLLSLDPNEDEADWATKAEEPTPEKEDYFRDDLQQKVSGLAELLASLDE